MRKVYWAHPALHWPLYFMCECPDVAALIGGGFLVPARIYAPTRPDLEGVRIERGDYVESQLAERMDKPQLVGDIVAHWHRLPNGAAPSSLQPVSRIRRI
ncbi:MAG: hypothetical protein ACJ8AH_07105 [Stellaceae bacterium]